MSDGNSTLYGEGKELTDDGVELTLANERSGASDQTACRAVIDVSVIFLIICIFCFSVMYALMYSRDFNSNAFSPVSAEVTADTTGSSGS